MLDERDGGQLRRLRDQRQRGEQADGERTGAERKREADQDDAAIERAGEARERRVADQVRLAALERLRGDGRAQATALTFGAAAARAEESAKK